MSGKGFLVGVGLICVGVVYIVAAWLQSVDFEQNCKGYLKRAADSNTVQMAQDELGKALNYMEENGLDKGKTHVFYFTPDCEIDFWYKNVKTAHDELAEFPSNADRLTISNQLMKLRETLMDDSGVSHLKIDF